MAGEATAVSTHNPALQRFAERATPTATTTTATPDAAARMVLDSGDAKQVAEFLKGYGGDAASLVQYLQEHRGNEFVTQVMQGTQQPSAWERLKKDGKLKFEATKAETPAATAEPTPEPTAEEAPTQELDPRMAQLRDTAKSMSGGKSFDLGSKSTSASGALANKSKDVDHSHATTSVKGQVAETAVSGTGSAKVDADKGLEVGGNADAKAKLVGTTVVINSKPMSYELFGEKVAAQFSFGLDAQTYAEAKGNVGMNVGWSGMAAKADLSGVGHGNVNLTAAASLLWSKQGSDAYASKVLANSNWRQALGRYVPSWMLSALPDDKVQGWIRDLIELMISGGSGDQVLLGATTTGNARAALGLPSLTYRGGALAVKPGAGLSFGGAKADFDLEMGKDAGMEMLTMLAFGGATALFEKLAPNLSIKKFFESKVEQSLDKAAAGDKDHDGKPDDPKQGGGFATKMAALRDKAKSLDGTHSKAWTKGKKVSESDVTSDGHDVTFTRDKSGSTTRTGDDARKHHGEMSSAPATTEKGKLRSLTEKALGDTSVTVGQHRASYSKSLLDKKTKQVEIAGAKGEMHGRALEVQGESSAQATLSGKGLSVGGNAGASAYLMGGQVQIETPNLPFTMLGEQVVGKVGVSVDAGAYAQVQGSVGLDVGWSGAGLNANLSGFAGVKAGITASGSLTWNRKPTATYVEAIVQSGTWKSMFGQWLPQWILNRAPDKYVREWVSGMIEMLVHGNGDALVLGAVARGEGSAGVGAAGAFSAKFQGGVLHCHGKAGITFGLGAGAAVDLQLGVLDGMAMLGVMALRGGTDLFNSIAPSMSLASYMQPLFVKMRSRSSAPDDRSAAPATRTVAAAPPK
jgi:hypothetical protein